MTVALPQIVPDCRGCGACCSDVGVPPYAALELFGLPRRLRAWWLAVVGAYSGQPRGRPCIALARGSHRCRIYRWRPAVCRDMPVGGEWCLMYRQRKGLA